MIRAPLLATLLAATVTVTAREAPVRIGDPGSEPDPSRFDERFPEMAEWARAGVEGGVPHLQRIVGAVAPGDDLPAAVAEADVSASEPGVLILKPGEYPIDGVLRMKPGLILRGLDRAECVIASTLNETRSPYGVGERHAIEMAARSGLEDLTVLNSVVRDIDESTYLGSYKNPGAPMSGLVRFGGKADNAWLQGCALTHAGSNPISISANHLTIRDCLIDKAYNKGGKGHGYLELGGGAHHVLFYNCEIHNIRHVSIMWKSKYVVIYRCRLSVDINYHDGLPAKQLVEKTTIRRRGGHHWSPISFGWPPWQDVGPGPRCFLWDNDFDGDGSGDDNVWVLRDTSAGYENMATKKPMFLDFGEPPAHGTLYAVTGEDIPVEYVTRARAFAIMEQAHAGGDYALAYLKARAVLDGYEEGDDEHAAAEGLIAAMEADAAEAYERVAKRPNARSLREFLATWKATDVGAEARGRATELAAAEFAEIGEEPSATEFRRFIEGWHGIAAIPAAARERYDALATEDLEKKRDRLRSVARMQRFVQRWPHSSAATEVEELWIAELRKGLDKLVELKDQMNERQRKAQAAKFVGTPLEQEARKRLLGE